MCKLLLLLLLTVLTLLRACSHHQAPYMAPECFDLQNIVITDRAVRACLHHFVHVHGWHVCAVVGAYVSMRAMRCAGRRGSVDGGSQGPSSSHAAVLA